jgi:hypothetical protein
MSGLQQGTPPTPPNVILEQYKTYIGDLGNIGSRHTQTNTWYVSILSALLVFATLTTNSVALGSQAGNATRAAVALLGILLSVVWRFHSQSFGHLYKAKFDVLREMEVEAQMFPCYESELQHLSESKYFHLTRIERWLILALAIPFVCLLVFSVAAMLT